MKTMKRIMALLICFVMVMGMTVTAFADDTKYTVTITNSNTDKAQHTYEAYQIFSGDLAEKNGVTTLSNITWGGGIDSSKLATLASDINNLKTGLNLTKDSSPSDFADAIAKLSASSDGETAQKLAQAIGKALNTVVAGTSTYSDTNKNYKIADLEAGYYLIKDKKDSLDNKENGAYTRFMLQVVKNTSVTEKASVPSVEKKVDDKNDSSTTEDSEVWQDSADYDIGDEVPFKLTATTADTVSDYTSYHVTFEDKQSVGLDAPTSFKITVLDQTLNLDSNSIGTTKLVETANGTKIKAEVINTDCTFAIKVTLTNKTGNKIDAEANGKTIVVTYNSVLNDSAVIGATGNPNEVYLKYSNNPNSIDDSEDSEGKTPKDKVIVFTYKAIVNKIDEAGNKLDGAGFTLYKKVADKLTVGAKKGSEIKIALTSANESIKAEALDDDSYYIEKTMTAKTSDASIFELSGIDDGDYVIVETTIPSGYNAFEAKSFTISADHETLSDDPKLTSLTATNIFTATVADGGILEATITNNSGSTLPSTGGIGTRIFYIIGGILMAAAAVVLITKIRYKKEK